MAAKRKEVQTPTAKTATKTLAKRPVNKTAAPPPKHEKPKQTDYGNYKIDYKAVDRRLAKVAFDQRVPNTHIYYLLGWSKSKFYAVCKHNLDFLDYLQQKRELARLETLRELQGVLTTAAKNGNITAVIFALKALGVCDTPQPMPQIEPEGDPNALRAEDFTLAELKKIHRCKVAARARKKKKLEKEAKRR